MLSLRQPLVRSWLHSESNTSQPDLPRVRVRGRPAPRHRKTTTCTSSSTPYPSPRPTTKSSKVLAKLLSLSTLPLTSYVPLPKTPLHRIDPSIKLAYILVFLVLIAKTSSIPTKLSIAAFFMLVQVATFPPRLWKPQLLRTLAVSGLVLFFTACGSDGVAPVLSGGRAVDVLEASTSPVAPASGASGLPPIANAPAYSYNLVNLGILSVTKRSWALATTLFSLTSMTLTTASITLLTTPPEKLAMSLKHLLFPLRIFGVQVHTLFLMTLFSLRFMAVVFEESRHLVRSVSYPYARLTSRRSHRPAVFVRQQLLGIASRGIDFGSLGGLGVLNILIKAGNELFRRLLLRADRVSTAMTARGVVDMTRHKVPVDDGGMDAHSVATNIVALGLLLASAARASLS